MTDIEFKDFLNYISVKDKQGNIISINKEKILKQYEQIKNFLETPTIGPILETPTIGPILETQRTRRARKRKTRKME